MNISHSKLFQALRIVGVCAIVATLGACGDKDSTPATPGLKPTIEVPTTSNPSTTDMSADTPAAPQITTVPTELEVQQAFRVALMKKVSQMAPDVRDGVMEAEEQRIATIKLGKCIPAPIGTPSQCFVSISGHTIELKFLLTQSGWLIVG